MQFPKPRTGRPPRDEYDALITGLMMQGKGYVLITEALAEQGIKVPQSTVRRRMEAIKAKYTAPAAQPVAAQPETAPAANTSASLFGQQQQPEGYSGRPLTAQPEPGPGESTSAAMFRRS